MNTYFCKHCGEACPGLGEFRRHSCEEKTLDLIDKIAALTAEVDRLKAELKTARAEAFREAATQFDERLKEAFTPKGADWIKWAARECRILADRAEREHEKAPE